MFLKNVVLFLKIIRVTVFHPYYHDFGHHVSCSILPHLWPHVTKHSYYHEYCDIIRKDIRWDMCVLMLKWYGAIPSKSKNWGKSINDIWNLLLFWNKISFSEMKFLFFWCKQDYHVGNVTSREFYLTETFIWKNSHFGSNCIFSKNFKEIPTLPKLSRDNHYI